MCSILTNYKISMKLCGAETNFNSTTVELTEACRGKISTREYDSTTGYPVPPPVGTLMSLKSTQMPLEDCLSNPYSNAQKIEAGKKKVDESKKKRKRVGNGLYIDGSVEFVIYNGDGLVFKSKKKNPLLKCKNIRIYPKTGEAQLPGMVEGDDPHQLLSTVLSLIKDCMEKTSYDYSPGKGKELKVVSERVNSINVNFKIKGDDNKVVYLYHLCTIIEEIRNGENPHNIVFITEAHKASSNMSFKFLTPIEKKAERMTTVKIFSSKKVNISGAPSFEVVDMIWNYVGSIIEEHKDELILEKRNINEEYEEDESTKFF